MHPNGKAAEIIDKMYVRKIENGRSKPFSILDSIEQFKTFGEGIYFYFCFLKFFGFVFFIMGLCVIPIILMNVRNDSSGISGQQNFLVKTSLGNLIDLEYDDFNTDQEIESIYQDYEKELKKTFYIFQGLDLLYSVILLISIIIFKIIIIKKRKTIEQEILTVQKYSLLVSGFPRDTTLDRLREFFSKFGTVVHANGIFDFQGALEKIQTLAECEVKRSAYVSRLESADKKETKKLLKKLDKKEKKSAKLKTAIQKKFKFADEEQLDFTRFDGFRLIKAFLTFDDHENMKKMYFDFQKEYKKGCCSFLKKKSRPKILSGGKKTLGRDP